MECQTQNLLESSLRTFLGQSLLTMALWVW